MYLETIEINTEYIKLDQLLKFSGIVESGAMAKQIILEGSVKVNDEVCLQRGKKIRPGNVIHIEDYGFLKVIEEEH